MVYNTNTMPNQRHKDKKFVGAWVPHKLYNDIKRSARQKDLDVTTWVTEKLSRAADQPGLTRVAGLAG